MSSFILIILFIIGSIALLIRTNIKNNKNTWTDFYSLIGITIFSNVIYIVSLIFLVKTEADAFFLGIISLLLLIPSVIVLIVGVILYFLRKKKIIIKEGKTYYQYILLIGLALFALTAYIDIKPMVDEYKEKASLGDYAIDYLNKKYGEGDYEILETRDLSDCLIFCFYKENANLFKVSSKYTESPFEIKVEHKTKKVYDDTFLETYAKEKKWCDEGSNLSICVESSLLDDIMIKTNDYYSELDVQYKFYDEDIFYGHIPTKEELKKEFDYEFESFIITKKIEENEEEFKSFLVDLYKVYKEKYLSHDNKDTINFILLEGNPFAKENNNYEAGGYIRITNDRLLLYYTSSPAEILLSEID